MRRGLSLIETLAAITLLAMLAAACLPWLRSMRVASQAAEEVQALEALSLVTPAMVTDGWTSGSGHELAGYRITFTAVDADGLLSPDTPDTPDTPYNYESDGVAGGDGAAVPVQWIRCEAWPVEAGASPSQHPMATIFRVVAVPSESIAVNEEDDAPSASSSPSQPQPPSSVDP